MLLMGDWSDTEQYRHVATGGGNGNGVVFVEGIVDDKPTYPLRKQVMHCRFTGVDAAALYHGNYHAGPGLVGAGFNGGDNLRRCVQRQIGGGNANQLRLFAG